MKKMRNLLYQTVVLFLALAWSVLGVLAQKPQEATKDEVSSSQLPPPVIEFAGQIGGTINASWSAWHLAEVRNIAYVGAEDGLHLINVSNPSILTEVGYYPMANGVGEITLVGNIAYVLNGYSVRFINIVNSVAPEEVGSYTFPFSQFPDSLTDITVSEDIAYVTRYDSGLYLLDILSLSAPILMGIYNSPQQTFGVAVAENKAYLSGGQSGLFIADLSDPFMPIEVGSHPGLMGWSNDVAAVGNTVYLADGLFGFGGLSIIDTSVPARPDMIGSINLGDARHVTIQGGYAYLLVEGDLHIVDISHPSNPVEVGFYDNDVVQWIDDLDVQNNYVYIAGRDKGLIILRLLRDKMIASIPTIGGVLTSMNGDTHFIFPDKAFTDPITLTYRHLWQDQDVGDLVGIGHTFELEAVYNSTGQQAQLASGQTFDIRVQYTDAEKGPAVEDTLALYYWDGNRWMKEASSAVNSANNSVTAQPNHWATLWAVLGETRRTFLSIILEK